MYISKSTCPVFGIRLVKSLRSKVSAIAAKNSNNYKISTYAKISIRVGVLILKVLKKSWHKIPSFKSKALKREKSHKSSSLFKVRS